MGTYIWFGSGSGLVDENHQAITWIKYEIISTPETDQNHMAVTFQIVMIISICVKFIFCEC